MKKDTLKPRRERSWLDYLDRSLSDIATPDRFSDYAELYLEGVPRPHIGLYTVKKYSVKDISIMGSLLISLPSKFDSTCSVQHVISFEEDYQSSDSETDFLFSPRSDIARCTQVKAFSKDDTQPSKYLSSYRQGFIYSVKRVIDDITAIFRLKKEGVTLDDLLRAQMTPEAKEAFKHLYGSR